MALERGDVVAMQEPHQRTGLRIPRGKSVILEIAQKTRGEIETFATATGHAAVPSMEPRSGQAICVDAGAPKKESCATPQFHTLLYYSWRGRNSSLDLSGLPHSFPI
jgi:hypothetical protein